MQLPILAMDICICLLLICFSNSFFFLNKREMQNMCVINNLPICVLTVFSVKLNRMYLCPKAIKVLFIWKQFYLIMVKCFYVSISTLLIQYNFQTSGFLAYDALEHHIKNEFSYSLSQCYIF